MEHENRCVRIQLHNLKGRESGDGGERVRVRMESREDLKSILPFLPLVLESSSLDWPSPAVKTLKALSQGPDHSNVNSGEFLFLAISDLRHSLALYSQPLAVSVADGYSLFFDDLISRDESAKWFGEVMPALATLLLRFPSLLETHYQRSKDVVTGISTGLRLLPSQKPGLVFLSQELIAALLACSFLCLFPITSRGAKCLPMINFDHLFASLYHSYHLTQENKIKCIMHYFKRICSDIPMGCVSFERKVLSFECSSYSVPYPKVDYWSKSVASLSQFKVHESGLIEDHGDALEVDFANMYIGGGALSRGCVQEEIRFMVNPELIAGMLFLPRMADNEAIEIVGAERFSNYTGYGSSFRFSGNHVDNREVDFMGRRKTRIIAIDALCCPGLRQYGTEWRLIRHSVHCKKSIEETQSLGAHLGQDANDCIEMLELPEIIEGSSTSTEVNYISCGHSVNRKCQGKNNGYVDHQDEIGIATGNWGCGAFGGDPELKAIIQWIAASQALRPSISYFTFGEQSLQMLDQVSDWILSHEWTVGDLWNMLVEYSKQRLKLETKLGFFAWLLPSLRADQMDLYESGKTEPTANTMKD
ncbi:Poly (ADP-ribose) glycohydrolase (PARG), catalytic domain, partial [Dillenia turbinata]